MEDIGKVVCVFFQYSKYRQCFQVDLPRTTPYFSFVFSFFACRVLKVNKSGKRGIENLNAQKQIGLHSTKIIPNGTPICRIVLTTLIAHVATKHTLTKSLKQFIHTWTNQFLMIVGLTFFDRFCMCCGIDCFVCL